MLQQESKPVFVNDCRKYLLSTSGKNARGVLNLITKFYTMVKQVLALKCVLLALLFGLFARDAAAYRATNPVTQSKKKTVQAHKNVSSSGAMPVVRDFDKLRSFKSYDPATNKWSTIEDFETVDILEDTTVQREDQYIYHSFWAYDAVKDCWHKVDVRGYGYELGQIATTAKTEETPEAAPQKSPGFWKKLSLGLRVGAGATFYKNIMAHCTITECDETFFLQSKQSKKDKTSYKINWFGAGYTQCGDPLTGSEGALSIRVASWRANYL